MNAIRFAWLRSVACALLAAACGCALTHSSESALPGSAPVSRWQPPQPLHSASGSNLDSAASMNQPRPFPMNEQIALMSQRVASAEDDRKVLASRLQMVEAQLEEKEKALAVATREIQETTAQVVRTRNELQQWKTEMVGLRGRLGNMDKEHRETLETIIKTLEQTLGNERAQPPVAVPTPELLPAPTPLPGSS